MQYREGLVTLTNGSPTVHAVFSVRLSAITGTFAVGSVVTFSGGTQGIVEDWSGTSLVLSFRVTSAGATTPNTGETVAQTTPAAADGALTEWTSRPDFAGNVTNAGIFTRDQSSLPYYVGGVDGRGRLSLTAPYAGASESRVAYAVSHDYTVNRGFPRPNQGDTNAALIVAIAIDRIDRDIRGVTQEWLHVGVSPAPAWENSWENAGGGYPSLDYLRTEDLWIEMRGGAAKTVGTTLPESIFTLPVNHRPGGVVEFPVVTAGGLISSVEITSAGVVRLMGGSPARVNFDGIRFKAEN